MAALVLRWLLIIASPVVPAMWGCVRAQGNAKALATVSAIIDGMGSIGAALGPMLTGYISDRGGFDLVFVMLYTSAFTAGLLLIKLAARELATLRTSPIKR